jgi:hypothetical protein
MQELGDMVGAFSVDQSCHSLFIFRGLRMKFLQVKERERGRERWNLGREVSMYVLLTLTKSCKSRVALKLKTGVSG